MARMRPPDRRASWTQKVRIGGVTYYLGFGERSDGRLAEVFITATKEGAFVRGVLDALARTMSVALQCGAPVAEVAGALRGCTFPPDGPVAGSPAVTTCLSVVDWIAQEMMTAYGQGES